MHGSTYMIHTHSAVAMHVHTRIHDTQACVSNAWRACTHKMLKIWNAESWHAHIRKYTAIYALCTAIYALCTEFVRWVFLACCADLYGFVRNLYGRVRNVCAIRTEVVHYGCIIWQGSWMSRQRWSLTSRRGSTVQYSRITSEKPACSLIAR